MGVKFNKDGSRLTITITKREMENMNKHRHENLTPEEFQRLKNRIRTSPRESFDVYIPENKLVIFGRHKDRTTDDVYKLNFGQYVQVCKMVFGGK